MFTLPYALVLGSASPRRQQLLAGMGFDFTIRVKEVDEQYPEGLEFSTVAEYLAIKKAESQRKELQNELLITADTLVALDGELLGKPADYADAFALLKKQSGKKQTVYTGVCLLTENEEVSFTVTTDVYFRQITDAEIRYYLENFQPYDKAGSYGVQEWMGYVGVNRIDGSYTNVMGFPTVEVYQALGRFAL
jgi:septum formation protein